MRVVEGLLLGSVVAFAQSEAVMQTIEIKDQRSVLLEQKESATASMVVSGEELARYGDLTPSDILKRLPGVSIPEGKKQGVSIRGLGKGYTKILVDGEELSGSMRDKILQLDRIPTSVISRIEVSTNGQAQYASDAVGGVVNIILKEPMTKTSTTAKVQVGEVKGEGTREVFVSHDTKKGDLSSMINLSYIKTADVFNQTKVKSTLTESQDDRSFNEMVTLTPKVVYDLDRYNKIGWDGFFSKGNGTENNGVMISDGTWRSEKTKDGNTMAKSSLKWIRSTPDGSKLVAMITGYDILSSSLSEGYTSGVPTLYEESRFRDSGFGTRGFYQKITGDHLLKSGWEVMNKEHKERQYRMVNGVYTPTPAGNTTFNEGYNALFMQDEISVGEKLIITPGVRLEHVTLHGEQLVDDKTDTYTTPSIHTVYKFTDNDQIRASIAKSVKRPRFDEYSSLVDMVVGGNSLTNPDKTGNNELKKEESWGFELKGEHYFTDKGIVSLTSFYRTIDNKIENRTEQLSGRYVSKPYNLNSAKLWGIEGEAKKRVDNVIEGLSFYLNGTWMGTSVTDETGVQRPLANTPVYLLNGGVDQVVMGVTTGVSFHHNGGFDRVNQANNIIATQKPTTTVDVYAIKKLSQETKLRLGVKNLFANDSVGEKEQLGSTELTLRSVQRVVSLSIEGKF